MRPTVVIGDVHGEAIRLEKALLSVDTGRRIVLLGDYIDRGPDSRGVLELLIEWKLRRENEVVLLRGNHEVVLLDFLNGASASQLIHHGGLATVRSYIDRPDPQIFEQFRRTFPPAHAQLLKSSILCVDEPGFFASHSGWDPLDPMGRTEQQMTRGGAPPSMHQLKGSCPPRDLAIFGHHTQAGGQPFIGDGFVCIDTGCGTVPNGLLTTMLLPEGEFHQF